MWKVGCSLKNHFLNRCRNDNVNFSRSSSSSSQLIENCQTIVVLIIKRCFYGEQKLSLVSFQSNEKFSHTYQPTWMEQKTHICCPHTLCGLFETWNYFAILFTVWKTNTGIQEQNALVNQCHSISHYYTRLLNRSERLWNYVVLTTLKPVRSY